MENKEINKQQNKKYYSKQISLTDYKNDEYLTTCGDFFKNFELCIERKVGQTYLCEKDKLKWDLCNYENKTNLQLFIHNKINAEVYINRCQDETIKIKERLEDLKK